MERSLSYFSWQQLDLKKKRGLRRSVILNTLHSSFSYFLKFNFQINILWLSSEIIWYEPAECIAIKMIAPVVSSDTFCDLAFNLFPGCMVQYQHYSVRHMTFVHHVANCDASIFIRIIVCSNFFGYFISVISRNMNKAIYMWIHLVSFRYRVRIIC